MKKRIAFLSVCLGFLFFPVIVLAGNPPSQPNSWYSIPSGQTTPANGSTTATMTLHLQDASSSPVVGDTVSLSASNDGTANFPQNNQVTDSGGSATFTMTSTTGGTDNVTMTDTSSGTTFTNWFTITFYSVASPTPTAVAACTGVPSAPVLSSVVSNSNYNATLSWVDSADPVANYLVSYGTASGKYNYGDPNIGGQGTTSFTVGSLAGGKRYYFVVAASNACGSSSFSNEVSVVVSPAPATPVPTLEPTEPPESPVAISNLDVPTDTPVEIDTPTPEATAQSGFSFKNLAIALIVSGVVAIGLVFIIQKNRKKRNRTIPPLRL